MKESDIQAIFSKINTRVGVFELKLCKVTSIAFSALARHQEKALKDTNGDTGCRHKLSDFSLEQKPFDCFNLANVNAYVVICFYIPHKKKVLYYIYI